ncbi:MAG TPA: cysteine desulfurase family protein [Chloroflexota bacterium]|nr:cysteine desulfurase family protein [Chloroflexota bacterium]
MARLTYLDHAATTPLDERVLEAMLPYLRERWGNPSSLYSHGRVARRALDESRDTVAQVLNCRPSEVLFTSGGTESDNLAIKGVAFARRGDGDHIVTTKIEHHAALRTCEWLEQRGGFRVTYVGVDRYGVVDLAELERAVGPGTILVSVMMANNEVGTIQPVADAAAIAHRHGATFHTDAVQAAGALEIDPNALGVDLLSLSGHKIYGPKGVGVLYVRRGTPLLADAHGGGQERGLRAGTENVAAVVGMAEALRFAEDERPSRNQHDIALRDRLIEGMLAAVPGARLTGHPTLRLPNSASFVFEGTDGESILMDLDQYDICASSGSACTSGTLEVSHVLTALGLEDDLARGSVRLTTGRATTAEGVEHLLSVMPDVVARVRSIMPMLLGVREEAGVDR